jgi:hypothetical protein
MSIDPDIEHEEDIPEAICFKLNMGVYSTL